MAASYKKLWKLLIDRDMLKRDLCQKANISGTTMAKLGKGESVNTDILLRICKALECDISDIVEVVPDEPMGEVKNGRRKKK
jgi:DNA-binding Xre family transcriptional regulator